MVNIVILLDKISVSNNLLVGSAPPFCFFCAGVRSPLIDTSCCQSECRVSNQTQLDTGCKIATPAEGCERSVLFAAFYVT